MDVLFGGDLLDTVRNGDIIKLRSLLDNHPHPREAIAQCLDTFHAQKEEDYGRGTPLIQAVKRGDLACVAYLVEHCRVDLEETGSVNIKNTAPHISFTDGKASDDREAFPLRNVTPLYCAAAYGRLSVLDYLVEKGADVNSVATATGCTALRGACFHDRLDAVVYLVERYEADVEIANSDGRTCLMAACRRGWTRIVQYLVRQAGADVNRRDKAGRTALLDYVERGSRQHNAGIIHCLLDEAKADRHAVDRYGNKPLYSAILDNHRLLVRHLLRTGNVRDHIDYFELFGAKCVEEEDFAGAFGHWRTALRVRADSGIAEKEEFTHERLIEIYRDNFKMQLRALLVRERMLGPNNPRNTGYFMKLGEKCRNNNVGVCVTTWLYSLKIEQNRRLFNDETIGIFHSFIELLDKIITTNNSNDDSSLEAIMESKRKPWIGRPVGYILWYVFKKCLIEVERSLAYFSDENNYIDEHNMKDEEDDEKEIANDVYQFNQLLLVCLYLLILFAKLNETSCYERYVTSVVKELLKNTRIKEFMRGGTTLLHLACQSGNSMSNSIKFPDAKLIEILLRAGDDPRIMDDDHCNALQILLDDCKSDNRLSQLPDPEILNLLSSYNEEKPKEEEEEEENTLQLLLLDDFP